MKKVGYIAAILTVAGTLACGATSPQPTPGATDQKVVKDYPDELPMTYLGTVEGHKLFTRCDGHNRLYFWNHGYGGSMAVVQDPGCK